MNNNTEQNIKGSGGRTIRDVTHFIRQWREFRRRTTYDVAADAGLTGSFISQLENGRSAYTQNSLERIAKALDCQPGQLLMCNPLDPEHSGFALSEFDHTFWLGFAEADIPKVSKLVNLSGQAWKEHTEELAKALFGRNAEQGR